MNKNGSWTFPKGHVNKGEDLLEAAKREIFEESGLKQLDFVKKLGVIRRFSTRKDGSDDKSEFRTIHIFLFRGDGKPKPMDKENPEAKWVGKNQVEETLTHPKDREFFRKNRGKIGY